VHTAHDEIENKPLNATNNDVVLFSHCLLLFVVVGVLLRDGIEE